MERLLFNQRSLYNSYKKRTKDIPTTLEEYEAAKAAAAAEGKDFYRTVDSLEYASDAPPPKEKVDRMVAELEARAAKRGEFSRRRRFYEEKDVDSINPRNEVFNKKIERAFGKYTAEIKNNLERGTALPDF
eukprot:jgi/Mesvir1/3389/Mv05090-RA.1